MNISKTAGDTYREVLHKNNGKAIAKRQTQKYTGRFFKISIVATFQYKQEYGSNENIL